MQNLTKNNTSFLDELNITSNIRWNLSPDKIEKICLKEGSATKTNLGAITVDTGKFTGRAPKDRYIVNDSETEDTVWWSEINKPFPEKNFQNLRKKTLHRRAVSLPTLL